MNNLKTLIDANHHNTNIINIPEHVVTGILPENTNTQIAVPTGARVVVFGVSGEFWLSVDAREAAIPNNTTPENGHCVYLPNARMLDDRHLSTDNQTKYLNIIAPSDTSYSIAFYK